jgi:uncharacterized protein involved in exopolysaccharide biosynthesis
MSMEPVAAPDSGRPPEGAAVIGLARLVLRHGRLIFGLPAAVTAAMVVVSLVLPRTYTAFASIKPQASDNGLGRLAGLAAQFGVAAPLGQSSESPDFYADLLTSRTILRLAVETPYHLDVADSSGHDLVSLYGITAKDRRLAVEKAAERLARNVGATADAKTNVVEFSVRTKWKQVSLEVTQRLLELVNQFNLQTRQSQAHQERRFVEARLAEQRVELRKAEDQLAAWLRNNRTYRDAPGLNVEYERLQRQVSERQKVFNTLTENFERASLDEVRSTPIVTVVERPALPVRPDSRKLALKCALTFLLAMGVAVIIALVLEAGDALRTTDPTTYAAIQREGSRLAGDLRRPWELLGRRRT